MTFSAIPYALQNSAHSADLFRQATSSAFPPGGGIVTAGDFAVTQTGTPSMNVSIGVGRIWIPGTNVGNVTGGNFSSQAMYYGQNDAAYTASVNTSDPINPRIDVVYAAVKDSQYAGSLNEGELAVVAGVPTSGATYPANAPAIPNNATALAYITVPAGASSILDANITRLLTFPASPASFARGIMVDTVSASADASGLSAHTVLQNIASFTFKAGRKYRLGFEGNYYTSNTDTVVLFRMCTCSPSDSAASLTGLTVRNQTDTQATQANRGFPAPVNAYFRPTADISLQVKITAERVAGTGTFAMQRAAATPNVLYIEDMGAQF